VQVGPFEMRRRMRVEQMRQQSLARQQGQHPPQDEDEDPMRRSFGPSHVLQQARMEVHDDQGKPPTQHDPGFRVSQW
jgi:hypothetical protein